MKQQTIKLAITVSMILSAITSQLTAMQPFAETKTHHAQDMAVAMQLEAEDEAMLLAPAAKRQRMTPAQELDIENQTAAERFNETDKKTWGTLSRLPLDVRRKINEFVVNKWALKETWATKTLKCLYHSGTTNQLYDLSKNMFLVDIGDSYAREAWDKRTLKMIGDTYGNGLDGVPSITISISETIIAAISANMLEISELDQNNELKVLATVNIDGAPATHFIKLSPTVLVSAHKNKRLRFWNISDIKKPVVTKTIERHAPISGLIKMSDSVFVISFGPTPRYTLEVWNVTISNDEPINAGECQYSNAMPDLKNKRLLLALSNTEFIAYFDGFAFVIDITNLPAKQISQQLATRVSMQAMILLHFCRHEELVVN